MLSRKGPEPPLYAPAPYAVPDTESLRRAALAASGRRGRQVGTRRLRWRWTLWFALRFGLPVLVGMGLFLLAVLHRPAPEPVEPAAQASSGERPMRLDLRWAIPPAPTSSAPSASPPADTKNLILQPDDWLHSKEP